ncbi:MAG: tetratricopeptide repeat protein [Acidobacteriota bacterium]|nr:tetratricopeptide repeat protein [Acidobacteriota bacterium]
MSVPRVAGILLLALALGACVPPVPGGATTADAGEIRDQLFKLQKDSARILGEIEQLKQPAGQGEERPLCAEAVTRIGELQHRLQVIEEQLLATQKRLDETLAEVRLLRRTPPPSWLPPSADGARPGAEAPAAPPGAATEPRAETATPAPEESTAAIAPEDLFHGAYADYSRGRYELALAGFEGALRADPAGPLADDCQYWIGECLVALHRYPDAVKAFEHLITAYPESDKLARAWLKKGIAQFEARRRVEGVETLETVIATWPDSDEARIAREYFRRKGILDD